MIASVDGCKAGWLIAFADQSPCKTPPEIVIAREFRSVVTLTSNCKAVVVDIPIGLPADGEQRLCDLQAKEKLNPAVDRVFLAPPRSTLDARTPEEFQDLHRQAMGKGAGLPVWGIVEKLREVDATMTADLQRRVFEFHPEMAWLRLAGYLPISKHLPAGITQRRDVLASHVHGLAAILLWKFRAGRAAKLDDVLDALVGLHVAANIGRDERYGNRLPTDQVPTDEHGLRMEIWY